MGSVAPPCVGSSQIRGQTCLLQADYSTEPPEKPNRELLVHVICCTFASILIGEISCSEIATSNIFTFSFKGFAIGKATERADAFRKVCTFFSLLTVTDQ